MAQEKAPKKQREAMVEANTIEETEKIEETEEEVEVTEDQDIPFGDDPSLLFASNEEEILEIIHQGRRWQFKYRQMTWGEKNYCVDKAQTWDNNGVFNFSLQSYYAAALTKMLTETPIKPITETTLSKLDRKIGEALISIVPQPIEDQVNDLKVL